MSRLAKILLSISLVLILGCPGVGLLLTVFGMVSSFQQLGQNGISSPEQLSGSIGMTLIATCFGFLGASVGVCVLIAAIVMIVGERSKPAQPRQP